MATEVDEKFPGAEKHEIALDEAVKHVQRHRKDPKPYKLHGGSFDRGIIDKILAQPGCVGLRFYYGQNEDSTPSLVLVGVDSSGKDMTKGTIAERQSDCPPFCSSESELLK
jgi:hypothetical protein